jgi:hypothetical protein
MAITLDGTLGITTPAETVQGALTTTGNTILGDATTDTLTVGVTGIVKDASGNVGIGTASPTTRLDVRAAASTIIVKSTAAGSNAVLALETSIDTEAASLLTLNINGTTTGYIGSGGATYPNLGGNNSLFFYNMANGPAVFATNGTERMRIDSGGSLLVGTTTAQSGFNMVLQHGNSGAGAGLATVTTTTGAVNAISFQNPNGQIGRVQVNLTTTTYVTSSDYRLKENIVPMTGALDKVSKLKPVTYTWKTDGTSGQGFIAHELQEFYPEAIAGTKDEVDEEGKPIHQGIDTSFLVATLTAAIQELKGIVDAQAVRIAALES